MLRYFKWSIIVTAVGLGLGAWLGWALTGTVEGMLAAPVAGCRAGPNPA